jgi:hypothetical protein
MTCVELEESLAELEDAGSQGRSYQSEAQKRHLSTCPRCSALLRELSLIIAAASELQASDEPSPRVWNSIEIALRQEGIIRPQNAGQHGTLPSFGRWAWARWWVPAVAMLLLAFGIYERQQYSNHQITQQAEVMPPAGINAAGLNDEDLIQEVAANAPMMRGQYEENLRRVNDSIRESQGAVDESPNDQDARRSLMDAYQQKAMLFEMAMNQEQ